MSNPSDLQKYLNGHLKYELDMLRYTLSIIKLPIDSPQGQRNWNAHFEAFLMHARNLYRFLTNGDSRNQRARDFSSRFKADKTDDTKSLFTKVNDQVFHLGKNRPFGASEKANVDGAQKVSDWIEINFRKFIGELAKEYECDWNDVEFPMLKMDGDRLADRRTLPARPTTTSLPGSEYTMTG